MDNTLRNEVKVTLDGKQYTMRATFEALSAIENDLRVNLIPLIGLIGQRNVGINQCATVIFHGLRGYGDNSLTYPQVGALVMKEGVGSLMDPVTDFLILGMEGVKMGKPEEPKGSQA